VTTRQPGMSRKLRSLARRVRKRLADLLWHRQASCGVAPSDVTERVVDCIYCGPGKTASKEHVVPQAIGGSFSRSDIICKECNSYFGREVDPHITNWHLSLIARDWFDLEGYSGTVPGYEVETEDGQMLTVGRKGALRPKWRDIVKIQDGKSFFFSAGTPTLDDAREAIARIIAKQTELAGRPPNVTMNRVDGNTRRDWRPYEADVVYDYRKQGRAIAKMALHYLATQLERRFLLTRDFEPIMRFVRHGEHDFHPRLCQPAIPLELDEVTDCVQHSLTLRCSRELRSAVCDVALFGVLRYSVVLSYSYEGPNLFRRLVENPLERSWDEGPGDDVGPIPASLILNIDEEEQRERYDRLEESVHGLVDWLNVYGFCHHVRETLPEVIQHVGTANQIGKGNVERWIAAVADEFSDRSSPAALLHFLGEPSRVAARILWDSLEAADAADEVTIEDLEARFARLVFIRLLADELVLVGKQRETTGE